MKKTNTKPIVIVGAGAAGLMAAIAASRSLREYGDHTPVIVLEKNEKSGKKIYITGKGRCNVCNASDMDEVKKQVIRNSKFLYSAFRGFTNQDTMDLFEEIGLPLKVERGNRVFPASDKSSDVIRALDREAARLGVQIRYHAEVKELLVEENSVCGVKLINGECISSSQVLLATGGLSYPSTGSTGDGYRFASGVGHTIMPTRPSLVPFDCPESWVRELQGLALKNISISLWQNDKKLYEEFGEMLFTHFGVSGPVILSASSIAGDALMEAPAMLRIDLKPALTMEQLDQRIIRDMEANPKRSVRHLLDQLLPKSLIPVILSQSGMEPDKQVSFVTREERKKLCQLLKALPVKVNGLRGYSEAVITKGGVHVKEVNPSTMESKLMKGLYLAGELLDVDAMTGGYNLQIAWSTGYAAGCAAARQAVERF